MDALGAAREDGSDGVCARTVWTDMMSQTFVAQPKTMPTPMPMKAIPVSWSVKPCLTTKMYGNAWKARYRIPKRIAVLVTH